MTEKISYVSLLATAFFISCSNSSEVIEVAGSQPSPAVDAPIEKIELTTGEEACRDATNGLVLDIF